jgi:5-methylcytosine-specific restriction endonuclease McrA
VPKRQTSVRDRHRAVIARGKPPCWICGQPIDYTLPWPDPKCYVVDHVTPLAKGGDDTLANKRAAHRDCNRAKSDRDFAPILRRSGSLRH